MSGGRGVTRRVSQWKGYCGIGRLSEACSQFESVVRKLDVNVNDMNMIYVLLG